MNFAAYSIFRNQVLSAGGVLDAGETRIVQALGNFRTPLDQLVLPVKAHRCHLAEFWLDHYGIDRAAKPRTLISKGVRHSLELLFRHWAAQGLRVAMPDDVYPVYRKLARAEGLDFWAYSMFPQADWEDISGVDVVLLTNPAKPRGTPLTNAELVQLETWLKQAPQRRVVIDAVYALTGPFDAATGRLLATGQAILLHSLSKAWVRPMVLGVALVPEADIEALTPVFRAESPEQDNLRLAQALITSDAHIPARLSELWQHQRVALQQALQSRGCDVQLQAEVAAYLFVVPVPFEQLLKTHGILGIPLSAFGKDHPGFTVVSSLGLPLPG